MVSVGQWTPSETRAKPIAAPASDTGEDRQRQPVARRREQPHQDRNQCRRADGVAARIREAVEAEELLDCRRVGAVSLDKQLHAERGEVGREREGDEQRRREPS